MADREQLYAALRNADAAGDTEAASKLAQYIQSMPSDAAATPTAPVAPQRPQTSIAGGFGMGLLRGAKDVIDTGADYLSRLGPAGENERVKAMNQAGRQEFDQTYGGSIPATIGRVGGNVAATLPAGGFLGAGMKALAPLTGSAAPVINALGTATATGGMRTGSSLGGAADMALRVGGGAISGGAMAGMVDPSSAGAGALIGGALPPAVRGAGALGGALRNSMLGGGVSPEVAQLATRAKELGINVPADRLVNSHPLNAVAASLNYAPFSGRSATEDAMSSQLNQALSRTFGQDSSNVTQALRKADSALGGEFDRVLKGNTLKVDQAFLTDLAEVGNRATRELPSDGASVINRQIDEIVQKAATGEIDGQAAYNLKKGLDRIGKRNSSEAYYATDLKQSLMGALDRSMGPEQAQAFAKTRQQYGTMLDLERMAKNGAEGELSVARVANMKNIRNPQVQELADIAAQFVKPREGQHGAMQRAMVGMGAGLLGGPQGLVAGAALGRGANGLLNSNAMRNYLLNAPSQPSQLGGLLGSGLYRATPLLGAEAVYP